MRRLLPLAVLCTVVTTVTAGSTTVIPPTFDTLVSRAGTIFVGEVIDVRGEWESTPEGRSIITLVTFRVSDVWKGTVGPVTQLEFLGGTIGDVSMVVAGMPRFTLGQRDVLFVGTTARAISPLVGFMHGRMRVERDGSGVERVRTFDGQPLGSVAHIGPQREAARLAGVTPMRLSDLAAAVRVEMNARRR
jgi:hypothetical protein